MHTVRKNMAGLMERWNGFVERHSILVVLCALVLSGIALAYTWNNLGMSTDTKDLLSPHLEWRKLDLDYEHHFPQYVDNMLVVVEAPTRDQALDGADRLYRRLRTERKLFHRVYYANALSVFRNSALLFLNTDELQDLSDNLAAIQPFLGKLTRDQTLRGLFSMLSDAVDALGKGQKFDLKPLVVQINRSLHAVAGGGDYRVSWHRLMSGEDKEKPVYREFILLQPVLDYGSLLPATDAINNIHRLTRELGINSDIGARVRLTGSVVLAHEQLVSVSRGTELALILAVIVVTVIMLVGMGSVRLVLLTLFTLAVGLSLTAGFATLTVGRLNLISVAFAVLYIGLGVDYAIHYCLRYRELLAQGMNNKEAIGHSSVNIGGSLFLCAATTAIGFFAFMPTDYVGVAELGWIAGSGIFISLVTTLTLLPALLTLLPLRRVKPRSRQGNGTFAAICAIPFSHARTVRIVSVVATIIVLGVVEHIRFDHNTLNLQDPNNESVRTYKDLLADKDTSPWTAQALAPSRAAARKIAARFNKLDVVEKTVWLDDFIPPNQDAKLSIIGDMSLLLGDLPGQVAAPPISDAERLGVLRAFQRSLADTPEIGNQPPFRELSRSLSAFLDSTGRMNGAQRHRSLDRLRESLLGSLPGRIATLRDSLNAAPITYANLPPDLANRWRSPDGQYLVEVYPRENINNNGALRRFVRALQTVDPRVIGVPVIDLEASDAVIKAFRQAFTYAFAVIAVLLLVLFTRKRDTLYVLAPLLMAAILTGGASVLLNIPLNFANIIALPLLLGIGVDSGIHIVHRFRTAPGPAENPLRTSSARAVIVSALTTVGGIGNLAFSPDRGTASMGELLTIGIAITLFCTLVVLPSLLAARQSGKDV